MERTLGTKPKSNKTKKKKKATEEQREKNRIKSQRSKKWKNELAKLNTDSNNQDIKDWSSEMNKTLNELKEDIKEFKQKRNRNIQ